MKRCNNCGWYNRNELTRCEKCGEPLGLPLEELESLAAQENVKESSPEPARPARTYSATMRDTGAAMKALGGEPGARVCPKCSYPLAGDDEICPNCGAKLRVSTRKDATHAVSAAAPAAAPNPYNATVRDVPSSRRSQPSPAPAKIGKETMTLVRIGVGCFITLSCGEYNHIAFLGCFCFCCHGYATVRR